MKKKSVIIIVISLILLILLFLYLGREKKMNHFDFPDTVIVNNYTDFNEIDTILKVITNKIMDIDTIQIDIFITPIDMNTDKYEIYGYTFPNLFEKNKYYIFLGRTFPRSMIKTLLSHEMVHIQQYMDGSLVYPGSDKYYLEYMGDKIYFIDIPYNKRPYEIEAFEKEKIIRKELNKILYK